MLNSPWNTIKSTNRKCKEPLCHEKEDHQNSPGNKEVKGNPVEQRPIGVFGHVTTVSPQTRYARKKTLLMKEIKKASERISSALMRLELKCLAFQEDLPSSEQHLHDKA